MRSHKRPVQFIQKSRSLTLVSLTVLFSAVIASGLEEPKKFPAQYQDFGVTEIPVEDGRLIFGEHITRAQYEVIGSRDREASGALSKKLESWSRYLKPRYELFNLLLQLRSQPDLIAELTQAYGEKGLQLPGSLGESERLLFLAAQKLLSEEKVMEYFKSRSRSLPTKADPLHIEWKGADDAESLAAAKKFLTEEAPGLFKNVPDLPLKVRQYEMIYMGSYSEKKGAFRVASNGYLKMPDMNIEVEMTGELEHPRELEVAPDKAEGLMAKLPGERRLKGTGFVVIDATIKAPADKTGTLVLEIESSHLVKERGDEEILHVFTP